MHPDFAERIQGSLITEGTPFAPENPDDYEYPMQDLANRTLYERYLDLAKGETGTLFCGRLGEYRYYDMDMAIGRALLLAQRLLKDA